MTKKWLLVWLIALGMMLTMLIGSLIGFIIGGFLSFILWSFGLTGSDMEDSGITEGETHLCGGCAGAIGILLIVLLCQFISISSYESKNYDLYYVSAPFGILWRDTSGIFIFASGTIQTDLKETYIVKYLVENQLYTMQFDANKNALIVDGSFILEERTEFIQRSHWLWGESMLKGKTTFYIHIPILPPTNGTTTKYEVME